MGVNLTWDESFIAKVAVEANKRNLGARALKSIIESSLFEVQWSALNNPVNQTILVTSETVDDPKKFILKP